MAGSGPEAATEALNLKALAEAPFWRERIGWKRMLSASLIEVI
jgi:hypothetical protein